jgi:endonuclease/exonuclease/phosphatase family metal-dependent hydrolase
MRSSIARGLGSLWLVLALVGCSDGRTPGPDGGAIDGAVVDASDLDAADLDAADLDAADLDAADLDASDLDAADLDAPDLDAPDLDAPDLDAPDLDAPPPDAAEPTRLRLVASNLTSGNFQRYEAPGQRLLDGLDPDVVLMQEWNVGTNTEAELRAFVDSTFGPGFVYTRESGVAIPNGVISRFPIVAAGVWDDPQVNNREFVWARLDVPGPRDLWAVSVHFLTTSASSRNAEAVALRSFVLANVPSADLLVIGGDLNTDSRTEAALTTLSAVVSTTAPHPADQLGDDDTSANRSKPYDWLLFDAELRAAQVPTAIGASSFPAGLVLDTRVYTPLKEVAPALAGDSAAANMQHMAVVKDVIVP